MLNSPEYIAIDPQMEIEQFSQAGKGKQSIIRCKTNLPISYIYFNPNITLIKKDTKQKISWFLREDIPNELSDLKDSEMVDAILREKYSAILSFEHFDITNKIILQFKVPQYEKALPIIKVSDQGCFSIPIIYDQTPREVHCRPKIKIILFFEKNCIESNIFEVPFRQLSNEKRKNSDFSRMDPFDIQNATKRAKETSSNLLIDNNFQSYKIVEYPQVMTLEQAASFLQVKTEAVQDLLEKNQIKGRNLEDFGWRILKTEIEKFLGKESPKETSK